MFVFFLVFDLYFIILKETKINIGLKIMGENRDFLT